jgi:hypothetical protein
MNIKFNFLSLLNILDNINYNNLYEYFSKNHKYNLFVKKYNDNEHLLMIHNNQNNTTKTENEIYKECRSIIIDTYDKPSIISYSHDNVLYSTIEEIKIEDNDIIEESYEGTMVNIFNYNDKWYFSSTKCPSIDNSYFFTDKKSHGEMLDDILKQYYPDAENARDEFVKNLNKNKCYFFIILHHENKYIVDYSNVYGSNYKRLVHIIIRDKDTQIEEYDTLKLGYLIKPTKFSNLIEAKEWLNKNESNDCCYKEGLIIKRRNPENNKNILIKIPSDRYTSIRIEKPNYSNVWVGCIEIFQRNNSSYSPDNYLQLYYPDKVKSNLDVTGILHLIFKNISYELYSIYMYFTDYNQTDGKYEKKNTSVFNKLFNNHQLKTFNNQIQKLQYYQYKYLKRSFRQNDVLNHLRNHTCPKDIYNMIKEHKVLVNSEHFHEIFKKFDNLDKINKYIDIYLN